MRSNVVRLFLAVACLALAGVGQSVAGSDPAYERACTAFNRGDFAAAYELFRHFAERGDPQAQHVLGELLRTGRGVARDDAEAAKWYRRAAEQGHRDAQCNLATLYFYGRGVERDVGEAILWWERAASLGSPAAALNLSLIHARGEAGMRNMALAYAWGWRARQLGHPEAERLLDTLRTAMTPDEITRAETMIRAWRAPSR